MMSCYGKWFAEANDLLGDQGVAGLPPVGKLRDSDTASFFGEPLIIGMPDDAIRMIDDYQRRTRLTHLVMITVLPGSDPAKVAASMKLFAKEVLPHFRQKRRAQPERS
jgi:alkanesulfonate monooxygenase SsuD/methylene tetrahydromethanopterin reductase-like flavin-dependent oxidoreductase (luciferase family)